MILASSDKKTLRQTLVAQRRGLSPEDWKLRSQAIVERLSHYPSVQDATCILAYFSIQQEPDLSPLFSLEKIWGFPVIEGKNLRWYPWKPGEPIAEGRYGIPVPMVQTEPIVLETVDLILVPGVAMDRLGYRLGYGGGFYDRLLASPAGQRIPTIGIVFEFALLPMLPRDPWDRPLGAWCTEASTSGSPSK
jgi:5-formyltetrahydrofolate cyclo-ligase